MSSVRWLDDARDEGPATLGGKGASLARMVEAGLPVPGGFVLMAEACSQLKHGEAGASEVLQELVAAWSTLSPAGEFVAVRSSGVDEDSSAASFAGQHESVLHVASREALLEAVDACLASAERETAAAYRSARGAQDDVAMAVVVQRMVDADYSGVAFSIDPVTGDERVVVNITRGTGERLVAGEEAGGHFVFERDGLALLEGDQRWPEDVARNAAEAVLRTEEIFGSPQDIEFAVDGEGLWFLQSRPITVSGGSHGWLSEFDSDVDPNITWTSANVQEVLPGLLTPLSMSVYERAARIGYDEGYQDLGMLARNEWPPFMACFYNRAFLNLTAVQQISDRTIGGDGKSVAKRYLGGDGEENWEREPWRRRAKFKLKSAVPLLRLTFNIDRQGERIERETRALEREVRAIDVHSLNDRELDDIFTRVLDFGARIFATHLQASGIALFGFENVMKLVRPVLGDEPEGRSSALFSGMHNVESARIGLDLWDLVLVARNTGIDDRIRADEFDPGATDLPDGWRAAWKAFLRRHGHRGLNEMETSARSWRADPAPVMRTLRGYLDLPPEAAPPAVIARQEAERLKLTGEIERRIGRPKRPIFRRALRDGQRWVALREQTKSTIVRAARVNDFLMPEIQHRLVAHGVIDAPDDVFFLARDEITRALSLGDLSGRQSDVARRRRELERNRYVELPERFTGHPVPLEPDLEGSSEELLTGTPVSPGIVTGRARVIRDPGTDGPLLAGEILVAPVTDAGWTPLFALAAGLVVDMGSALSHGSTVAREYGLPAVVNVHHATRIIRDGDLLTVNGTSGKVGITRSQAGAEPALTGQSQLSDFD